MTNSTKPKTDDQVFTVENQCCEFDATCLTKTDIAKCWLSDPCMGWCPLLLEYSQKHYED